MDEVQKVYIGSSSDKGIAWYNFQNGELSQGRWTKDERKCTYLAKYENQLYAVVEIDGDEKQSGGYVVSYIIEKDKLKKSMTKPSCGKGPCHIAIHPEKHLLCMSHYTDGTFCVIKQEEGDFLICENLGKGSHVHCGCFQGDYLIIADLGKDQILAYQIEKENLKRVASYQFKQGSGPRHLIWEKEKVYVLTEQTGKFYEFTFQNKNFTFQNCISLLPSKEKESTGCAIRMSQDKQNIYITIRGKNTVCVLRKEQEKWKKVQEISSEGELPWDIQLDQTGQFALVANTGSNQVSIFARKQENGMLTYMRKRSSRQSNLYRMLREE